MSLVSEFGFQFINKNLDRPSGNADVTLLFRIPVNEISDIRIILTLAEFDIAVELNRR